MNCTDIERSLIVGQANRDTLWCAPCGIGGNGQTKAVARYHVGPHGVLACSECLRRSVAEGVAESSEPVTQPAWVELLTRLMDA